MNCAALRSHPSSQGVIDFVGGHISDSHGEVTFEERSLAIRPGQWRAHANRRPLNQREKLEISCFCRAALCKVDRGDGAGISEKNLDLWHFFRSECSSSCTTKVDWSPLRPLRGKKRKVF